ncbi:MAG TPA: sensor domain-containing protein [Propionibacteriaceae bacterium]|nr:sensor domain-containing protein [Propionibacteriaceae bacterium]
MSMTLRAGGAMAMEKNEQESGSGQDSYLSLWRAVPGSLVYLVGGFVLSMVALSVLSAVFFSGVGMVILVVGLPLVVGSLLAARGFGLADRTLLKLTGLPEIAEPAWPVVEPDASVPSKLLAPMRSSHYWSYLLHQMVVAPILATLTFSVAITWAATALGGLSFWMWAWLLPGKEQSVGGWISRGLGVTHNGTIIEAVIYLILGVVTGVTLPWVLRGLSRVHHGVASAMLGRWPSDDLATEVRNESAARVAAIAAEDGAMRRLERDLHDGPQQRLVRLQMDLAAVERRVSSGQAEEAVAIAKEAQTQAKAALEELRALSRGVAPPLLQDRGLCAALTALAEESPLPVTVALDPALDELVAPDTARALYFVVAELLTNAAKHAGARTAQVTGSLRYDEPARLRLTVSDDGTGGASMVPGHGLAGLAERLRGLRGQLTVESPDGGPTRVDVTVPLRTSAGA